MSDALAEAEFHRQLEEAAQVRGYVYSIVKGTHEGRFEQKDYIGLSLFNRCLQTHQATEITARSSLIDDAWVLVRALVEHAVNCIYMLYVADSQTAADFADYGDYLRYSNLLDLWSTDEELLRRLISPEDEERMRVRYEAVRARFDGKHGDKWCADNALYKRAKRVDKMVGAARAEPGSNLLFLVNSVWRYASTYTHATADALDAQLRDTVSGVIIHREYTHDEAARVLYSANMALYSVVLPVDVRLGGGHVAELNRRLNDWISAGGGADLEPSPRPPTDR